MVTGKTQRNWPSGQPSWVGPPRTGHPAHTFLAQRRRDLPPNFRFLIASRPESGVEPALTNARSVRTFYMDDPQLGTNTEQDIGIYLRNKPPENVFKDHAW
jgi:hypothetical protein